MNEPSQDPKIEPLCTLAITPNHRAIAMGIASMMFAGDVDKAQMVVAFIFDAHRMKKTETHIMNMMAHLMEGGHPHEPFSVHEYLGEENYREIGKLVSEGAAGEPIVNMVRLIMDKRTIYKDQLEDRGITVEQFAHTVIQSFGRHSQE